MNEHMNGRTEEEATYAAEQTNQTAAAEGKVVKSFFGAGKALRPAATDGESYVFALGIDPI